MSIVTNIIIATSISEDPEQLAHKFKEFQVNGNPFALVSIDNEALPKAWYGGSKMIEANVFIGAYNHLDLNALISFMRERVSWENPECVQLICKEENAYKFTLIDVFPG
jgi:hypothetical protein